LENHSKTRSSRKLELASGAEHDLGVLLAYSLATWGAERRDAYAERLSVAMHELLTHPFLGRARDDVWPGLRGRLAGQHVIYYVADERTVRIIRILHAKMNPASHLPESP
jgi:toxin ParE1/3/4